METIYSCPLNHLVLFCSSKPPHAIRSNMADDVKALSSMVPLVDNQGNQGGLGEEREKNKPKPLSKQLVSKLQGCSQRLTEVMSWQAKLDTSALKLA